MTDLFFELDSLDKEEAERDKDEHCNKAVLYGQWECLFLLQTTTSAWVYDLGSCLIANSWSQVGFKGHGGIHRPVSTDSLCAIKRRIVVVLEVIKTRDGNLCLAPGCKLKVHGFIHKIYAISNVAKPSANDYYWWSMIATKQAFTVTTLEQDCWILSESGFIGFDNPIIR